MDAPKTSNTMELQRVFGVVRGGRLDVTHALLFNGEVVTALEMVFCMKCYECYGTTYTYNGDPVSPEPQGEADEIFALHCDDRDY